MNESKVVGRHRPRSQARPNALAIRTAILPLKEHAAQINLIPFLGNN
jgi:hypothetical protein